LINIFPLLIQKNIDVQREQRMESCRFRLSTLFCRHNENLINIIQLLLEKNIDVNSKVNEGWKRNVLQNLVRCHYKNEIFFQDKEEIPKKWNQQFPLPALCGYYDKQNFINIFRLLIQKNIDVNSEDNNGWNVFVCLKRQRCRCRPC
jgi:ankyrin repeat protein